LNWNFFFWQCEFGSGSEAMIIVEKARADDFEKIYPLLLEFNDSNLTKDDWRQLFVDHCGGYEDYIGFVLLDQGKVVGFLGLIFSNRLIENKVQKFCNMTSWIIKKEYQRKGLGHMLFLEVIKLKEYTITILPPAPQTVGMFKKYGFKELEDSFRLVLPIPAMHSFSDSCSVVLEQEVVRNNLNCEELKIYNDHLICKCMHILIKAGQEGCYVIARRVVRKGVLFAEIHYLSNLPLFLKYIDQIKIKLSLGLKVWGLVIEERLLQGHKIKYSITRKLPRPKLFKSSLLDKDKITDNLYTELLILNL